MTETSAAAMTRDLVKVENAIPAKHTDAANKVAQQLYPALVEAFIKNSFELQRNSGLIKVKLANGTDVYLGTEEFLFPSIEIGGFKNINLSFWQHLKIKWLVLKIVSKSKSIRKLAKYQAVLDKLK